MSSVGDHVRVARPGKGENLKVDNLTLEPCLTVSKVEIPKPHKRIVETKLHYSGKSLVEAYPPLPQPPTKAGQAPGKRLPESLFR